MKRAILMAALLLVMTGTSWAADVWTFQLEKVQPTWNTGTRRLTVPVRITVSLNIDGAGAQVFGVHTASTELPWGSDIQAAYVALKEPLQQFIDKCKKERLAMKSAQFTNLVVSLAAGLTI